RNSPAPQRAAGVPDRYCRAATASEDPVEEADRELDRQIDGDLSRAIFLRQRRHWRGVAQHLHRGVVEQRKARAALDARIAHRAIAQDSEADDQLAVLLLFLSFLGKVLVFVEPVPESVEIVVARPLDRAI